MTSNNKSTRTSTSKWAFLIAIWYTLMRSFAAGTFSSSFSQFLPRSLFPFYISWVGLFYLNSPSCHSLQSNWLVHDWSGTKLGTRNCIVFSFLLQIVVKKQRRDRRLCNKLGRGSSRGWEAKLQYKRESQNTGYSRVTVVKAACTDLRTKQQGDYTVEPSIIKIRME